MNKYNKAFNRVFNEDTYCLNDISYIKDGVIYKKDEELINQLIDKETPMKVDKNTKGTFPNYDKDDTYHTTYKCPKCNCTIHLDWHEEKNFCPVCGQKLDWSDVDE